MNYLKEEDNIKAKFSEKHPQFEFQYEEEGSAVLSLNIMSDSLGV